MKIRVLTPPGIRPDSWLMDAKYEEFRRAYAYACTQSHAIPALSAISAEQAYALYFCFQRGPSVITRCPYTKHPATPA